MKILAGLYFPGTEPDKEVFLTLLCLLDQVNYYRIVEGETGVDSDEEGAAYWQGRVVLPLGEDRVRFLAMIRDIRSHSADFYGGYLSALSASSLVDRDESSVWQLVANLHGHSNSEQDRLKTRKLWQARMVLYLAEIMKAEQVDLANDLAELGRREQAASNALKGDIPDADDDQDIFQISNLNLAGGEKRVSVGNLLKAWGTLFVIDPSLNPFIFTDNEDAAAIIFDGWEELSGERPQHLAEIKVPLLASVGELEAARVHGGEAGSAINDALKNILDGKVASGTAELKTALGLWRGRELSKDVRQRTVGIYLLQGHSLKDVWARVCHLPVDNQTAGDQQSLVAVLGPIS